MDRAFSRTGHRGRVERGEGPDRFFSLRIPHGGGYYGASGFVDGQGQSKSLESEHFNFKQMAFLVSASSHTIGDTISRLWLLTGRLSVSHCFCRRIARWYSLVSSRATRLFLLALRPLVLLVARSLAQRFPGGLKERRKKETRPLSQEPKPH